MTLFRYSRHQFCTAEQDDDNKWFLTPREPYGYKKLDDNYIHMSESDETWADIADIVYGGMDRGCGLWHIILDFQPIDDPIIDPTLKIPANREIHIPSQRALEMEIYNEERRKF